MPVCSWFDDNANQSSNFLTRTELGNVTIMGWTAPPQIYISLKSQNVISLGNRVTANVIKIKNTVESSWVRRGRKHNENVTRTGQKHTGKRPCEAWDRDHSDTTRSQETAGLGATGRRRRQKDPPRTSREALTLSAPWFWTDIWVSRMSRIYSVVFIHSIFSIMFTAALGNDHRVLQRR